MKMGKTGVRFVTLLAALVVVAGCTKKTPDTALTGADANMAGATSTDTTGMQSTTTGMQTPGSAQDFVVNVGDRVFFGYDQYDLSSEARMTSDKQATWLKQYPATHVLIEGHADERGTREYNLALGEKRAMALRNYLIANGVDAGRIQTISYGKERPAVTGSDESAWAQNRRAVVVIQ